MYTFDMGIHYSIAARRLESAAEGRMGRILLIATQPELRAALTLLIQQQSGRSFCVEEASCVDAARIAASRLTPPDIVVLVAGIAISRDLRPVASIRTLIPSCPVVVVDTLGLASTWYATGWDDVDALLRSDQLATELVPTICRLVAPRDSPPSQTSGDAELRPR